MAMEYVPCLPATIAVANRRYGIGVRRQRRGVYAWQAPDKPMVIALFICLCLASVPTWPQQLSSLSACKPDAEAAGKTQNPRFLLATGTGAILPEEANAHTRTVAARVSRAPLIERRDDTSIVTTRLQLSPGAHEGDEGAPILRVEELRVEQPAEADGDHGAQLVAAQTSVVGTYILSLDEARSEHDVAALLAPFDVGGVSQIARRSVYVVRIPGDDSQEGRAPVVDEIRRLPHVLAIDPNFLLALTSPADDPQVAHQWHLYNDGSHGGTAGADIGARKGWALSRCNSKPVVAVIDTGIAIDAQDLKSNIWINERERDGKPDVDDDGNGFCDDERGWDFVSSYNNVATGSGTHGAMVAAIIAAVGGNEVGGSGICPQGRIMPIRAVRSSIEEKPEPWLELDRAVKALYYALDNGATIINASWGMNCFSKDCPPQSLRIAIEEAARRQILVVTAAGNAEDTDIDKIDNAFYPASFDLPNVIAVAASDRNDKLWSGSSWGRKSVELAAPGKDICAPSGARCYPCNGGTSYATAMVTGAALLVTDRFGVGTPKRLPVERLRSQILDNVDKSPRFEGKTATGGRLNVYKALCVCPSWMSVDECSPCPDYAEIMPTAPP